MDIEVLLLMLLPLLLVRLVPLLRLLLTGFEYEYRPLAHLSQLTPPA